jgi:hypothetical protein
MVGGDWEERRLYEESIPAGSYFGNDLCGQVDVNLDGIPDQIIGAPTDDPGGMADAGSVFVYSGSDGALLHHFTGPHPSAVLGWSVAATDLDGDGYADILAGGIEGIGSAYPGTVYAWSGATGQLLYEISLPNATNYGESLAIVADRDQDQIDDILIGCSDTAVNGMSYAGIAELRSGADGSLLHRWLGSNPYDNFGADVTELGDLNGDGVGEFAFGMPGWSLIWREGAVKVVDGSTYQDLTSFTILYHGSDQQLGVAIANPGDVNNDGVGDLLVGATASGVGYQGRAYIIDGASHLQLVIHEVTGRATNDFFGESLCGAGDVNQDGFADFLVGAGEAASGGATGRGYVELYSGLDGSLMQSWNGASDFDRMGRVALAGDINGDGDPEIMMGAWLQSGGPGYVSVVGLDGFLSMDDRSLSLSAGTPITLEVDFPTTEAGLSFSFLLSHTGAGSSLVGGIEVPLANDNLFRAMLRGWSPPILTDTRGVLDSQGNAIADLQAVPALVSMLGRSLYLCAISFDAATMTASRSSVSRSFEVTL